jgi:hypothetical protein
VKDHLNFLECCGPMEAARNDAAASGPYTAILEQQGGDALQISLSGVDAVAG